MAEKHPYVASVGGLVQTLVQFRKNFPAEVKADTLTKLGFAPNNESYIITILKYLGLLDEKGKKTSEATTIFSKHGDEQFQPAFEAAVKTAYRELFELHGDDAWTLPVNDLISFFRGHDHTSDVVGQRQARTFQALAGLSGHGTAPTVKAGSAKPATAKPAASAAKKTAVKPPAKTPGNDGSSSPKNADGSDASSGVALSVRIEVNLPANGDQATYDRIFKSIRENLLRG